MTKIKMDRFIFIFLVVTSLGISVFCIRKKYTHAVDDEQYPILVGLTDGKFHTFPHPTIYLTPCERFKDSLSIPVAIQENPESNLPFLSLD